MNVQCVEWGNFNRYFILYAQSILSNTLMTAPLWCYVKYKTVSHSCSDNHTDEKGLRKYIESDLETLIVAEADNLLHGNIRKEEKACISIIVQSIHDSQLEYVKDKKTAKSMFDNLASDFERKSTQ